MGAQCRPAIVVIGPRGERLFGLLHRAQISFSTKTGVFEAATAPVPLTTRLSRLQAMNLDSALETAVCELLLARPDPG